MKTLGVDVELGQPRRDRAIWVGAIWTLAWECPDWV